MAIIVLGRSGGEGADLPTDMYTLITDPEAYNMSDEMIGAVILAPGTGASGFNALGKILNGSVNPSGKTVDTYVRDLTTTPGYLHFGRNFTYSNTDDLRTAIAQADPAYEGNMAFTNYVEGIYVGYKFYETAAEEVLINYEDQVLYPFGYGLSYTTFSQEISAFNADGENVILDVTVTISIRSDSHTPIDSKTFEVAQDTVGRGSDITPASNRLDYARGNVNYLSRDDSFANYAESGASRAW